MRISKLRKELPSAVTIPMLRYNFINNDWTPFASFIELVRSTDNPSEIISSHAFWCATRQGNKFWHIVYTYLYDKENP